MHLANIPALMQEQERPLRLKAVHIISKYVVHPMIERQMVSTPLNGEQNIITESQKGPRSVKALGAVLLDTVVFLYTKIFHHFFKSFIVAMTGISPSSLVQKESLLSGNRER